MNNALCLVLLSVVNMWTGDIQQIFPRPLPEVREPVRLPPRLCPVQMVFLFVFCNNNRGR